MRWIGHLLGRVYPADTTEPRTESGYPTDHRFNWLYGVAALAIGLGFALLWESLVQGAPIPPGDDPSTWIATSYYFIGVPAPTGVQPLAYPPASFPFIGLSVWLAGNPLLGGRIFMGAMIVILGLSTYVFSRSLLKQPALALLAEGLWIAEPDFQQLYYFGGYPNIFSLVFLLLALAFLVRYLRSRKGWQLLVFWASCALCVLSHTLTASVLGGTLILLALGLILLHRLPRTIVWSRAGMAGLATFLASVGAYYGGTALEGIAHESYLSSSSLGATKAQLVPTVLRPLYLGSVVQWLTRNPYTLTATTALQFMAVVGGVLLLVFFVLWRLRPQWITLPWLVLLASILTIFLATVIGYELSLPVDYRRFPYFLYGPVILAGILILDTVISRALAAGPTAQRRRLPPPVASPPRRPRTARAWRPWVEPAIGAATVVLLVLVAQNYTVPSGNNYEAYYTLYGHDQNFLSTVSAIDSSGIPGNILSTTPLVGHWSSTLTSRTTYDPSAVGGNSYTNAQVTQGELTDLVLGQRFTVTNSLVAGGISGVEAGDFNASPVYGAFDQNLYQPVLQFPTSSFEVGFVGGAVLTFASVGSAAPPISSIDNGTGYQLTFTNAQATLLEQVVAVPGTATVDTTFVATTTNGSTPLAFVQARIGTIPSIPTGLTGVNTTGTFQWNTSTSNGNFTTNAVVAPSAALYKVLPVNASGIGSPTVVLHEVAPTANGSRALTFSIALTTPDAVNVLPSLGPWVNADAVWANWSIRFVLLFNGSASARSFSAYYYETEYGAARLSGSGLYAVWVFPSTLIAPPYLQATSAG